MASKYSLENRITIRELGRLASFFITGLFLVGLIYLIEYSVNVGMTFQLDREEKNLKSINEDVDNLRIRNISLSRYNKVTMGSTVIKSRFINPVKLASQDSSEVGKVSTVEGNDLKSDLVNESMSAERDKKD